MMNDTPPSPSFFIIRTGSTDAKDGSSPARARIVPLIPADVLPEWLEIKAYPRSLTPAQTAGMTSLGSFGPSDKVTVVNLTETPSVPAFLNTRRTPLPSAAGLFLNAPSLDEEDRTGKGDSLGRRNKSWLKSRSKKAKKDHQPSVLNPTSPTTVRTAKRRADDEDSDGDAEKDEVMEACKFWVKYGRCGVYEGPDKHVVPTTLAGLAEFGLDELPLWYMRRQKAQGKRRKSRTGNSADDAAQLEGGKQKAVKRVTKGKGLISRDLTEDEEGSAASKPGLVNEGDKKDHGDGDGRDVGEKQPGT